MNRNQPTTYIDLNETDIDDLKESTELGTLTAAYADLGKAFYEYRFEEPTPELLLYFDRITELLKTTKEAKRQREEHIEPMAAKTASKGDYKIDTTPQSTPKNNFPSYENSTSTNKKHFDEPIPDNSYPAQPNWEDPQNLESSFWENTQDIIGTQQTFVMAEVQKVAPIPPTPYNRQKRGPLSPFHKKEKDRVSSLEDLPSIDKENDFSFDINSSQSLLCPVCGNPIEPGDGFCGHCGTRLN